MNKKLILFFTLFQLAFISEDSVSAVYGTVEPWLAENESAYQHVYHFGESEMESKLLLIYAGGQWYAQIESGQWADEGSMRWLCHYENLANVKIVGNRFYSDKTNGEFVMSKVGEKVIKGLKVYKSWSAVEGFEIGYHSHSVQSNFSGQFKNASYELLTESYLSTLTKKELKIMRNEIYARYRYVFLEGGEMAKYFNKKLWYQKEYDNVDAFLTNLEKINIELIKQIEKQ